jgi:hypothetical protein
MKILLSALVFALVGFADPDPHFDLNEVITWEASTPIICDNLAIVVFTKDDKKVKTVMTLTGTILAYFYILEQEAYAFNWNGQSYVRRYLNTEEALACQQCHGTGRRT